LLLLLLLFLLLLLLLLILFHLRLSAQPWAEDQAKDQACKKQKLVMTTASDELRALALPVMTRQCHKVKSSSSLSPAS
jgi:hypothetical protein